MVVNNEVNGDTEGQSSTPSSGPNASKSTGNDLSQATAPKLEYQLTPLVSDQLTEAWKERYAALKELPYEQRRIPEANLSREILNHKRGLVLERAEEFAAGLLLLVGTRNKCYKLDDLFTHSKNEKLQEELANHNTPENRRALHTLLKALSEIPRNWARSTFVRHLRNNGTQKGKEYKYYGKGAFGADFGWKEKELSLVCDVLMGNEYSSYGQMLIAYADVESEIRTEDPDLEGERSYEATFAGTRTEKYKPLIDKLCEILEKDGLASVPEPKKKAPSKPRPKKEFKPGDTIRKGTLKDLPLPALVRVPIEKTTDHRTWEPHQVEWVVHDLLNWGEFVCYRVGKQNSDPRQRVAYRASKYSSTERKELLDGATYLGPWEGTLNSKKFLEYEFRFRRPEKTK